MPSLKFIKFHRTVCRKLPLRVLTPTEGKETLNRLNEAQREYITSDANLALA